MGLPPIQVYADNAARADAAAGALNQRGTQLGLLQLVLFVVAVAGIGAGISRHENGTTWFGVGVLVTFFIVRIFQARVIQREERFVARATVLRTHVARLDGTWRELKDDGADLRSPAHPHASDLDILGHGSLFQRISVAKTKRGREILALWLLGRSTPDEARERASAVKALVDGFEFRTSLEVALSRGAKDSDHFVAMLRNAPTLHPLWRVGAWVLPVLNIGALVLSNRGTIPDWLAIGVVVGSIIAGRFAARTVGTLFDVVAARRSIGDAYRDAFELLEKIEGNERAVVRIRSRVTGSVSPSQAFRALDTILGYAELRRNPLVHIPINAFLLWDVHVALRLERWVTRVKPTIEEWFRALGEAEALESLAALAYGDASVTFPEIADEPGFDGTALGHPLISASKRVANDVSLPGPGSVLIVTGSNMAGKSTLLRAIGLNAALAFAGGPVFAEKLRVGPHRLRVSMRIADSLEDSTSTFRAELDKLAYVIEDIGASPPILFLLDELLRGTNERARHLGARAIVEHLIAQGSFGVVATHDIALGALAGELPGRAVNAHFTDVMVGAEMRFDYTLRPGIVRTSNALRLLRGIGVPIPEAAIAKDADVQSQ